MTADRLALRIPSPLTELEDDRLSAVGVRLLLKRDDLIHTELTGNKWRKLMYNLAQARSEGADTLLTYGAPTQITSVRSRPLESSSASQPSGLSVVKSTCPSTRSCRTPSIGTCN